jgi:hypothetical protein
MGYGIGNKLRRGLFRQRRLRQYVSKCSIAALLVALFGAGNFGAARAEEGCPSGMLPSSTENTCNRLSTHTELPLDPSKPMVFEAIQTSMTTIYIQAIGTITPDTPQQFQKFLKTDDAKMTRILSLHSAGGDVMAGLKLGEMIREARFNTSIGRSMPLDNPDDVMASYDYKNAVCTSACAYAFLGGVTRTYGKNDIYGLPRFGVPGNALSGADPQAVSDILAKYIESMGANPEVLQAAASAPPNNKIFRVPTALGEKMNIIYDKSGETTFRTEAVEGHAAAAFDFTMAEKRFGGQILCINGANRLIIIDRDDTIRPALRQLKQAPATFTDGTGKQLDGSAIYLPPSHLGAGDGTMVFRVPEMTAASFSGEGFKLDDISNPQASGDVAQSTTWTGDVMAFFFRIKASNGAETLPPILRECAKK